MASVFTAMVIETPHRRGLKNHSESKGVGTGIYYPSASPPTRPLDHCGHTIRSRNRSDARAMKSRIWLLGTCLLVGMTLSACSPSWIRQPETGFHASLDGSFRYGNISGFLQIPKGGGVGSTSNDRPRFNEIGIHQAPIGDAALTLGWDNNEIYAGARFVRLSGKDTLSSTLISNGTTFPAGSPVNANTQLDWYRGGYAYRLSYGNDEGARMSFYPAAGFALFSFDYRLDSPASLTAARSFAKAAPQLGFRAEWSPGGPFSLSADLLSSLAFSTLPLLFSTDLTGGYQLWGQANHGAQVYLGLGYEMIQCEDNQSVPNHIKANIGPELVVGLKLSF